MGYDIATNGAIIVKNAIYKNLLKYVNVNIIVYTTNTKYIAQNAADTPAFLLCTLSLATPIKDSVNLESVPLLYVDLFSLTSTTMPLDAPSNKLVTLCVIIKIPDIIKCIIKTKHNATNQSLSISLCLAFSAIEPISIFIPI